MPITISTTIASRFWPNPSEVTLVDSFSGSMKKISAAVYTVVVLWRACASMAEPALTTASTSATATRIFVLPPGIGSATES